jgi:ribonucleoside-diphosphate reductase alpha chain
MYIRKRNGALQEYNSQKIRQAIRKSFASLMHEADESVLDALLAEIEKKLHPEISVEEIQDLVEENLMNQGFHQEAKSYILYRQKHADRRETIRKITTLVPLSGLDAILKSIQRDFDQSDYSLELLYQKLATFYKEGMDPLRALKTLEQSAVELVSRQSPQWEMIAARILAFRLHLEIDQRLADLKITNWADQLAYLEKEQLLGSYILGAYSKEDMEELSSYIKDERDALFNHSGLDLVAKRYLICDHQHHVLETPQQMFMAISMHLAIPEENRVYWAKEFYDILSTLEVTMATPTMSNARKPFHQMSSCFIDTVEDSLTGIYKTIDNFAQVSKHGGGMGIYLGKVRANGSSIRGFEGAAGGVIRWIKLMNDTATAVDQLGVRQGACAVYLDAWHKDLPEFLQLRTNNGDDRMKAHDIFPAVCFPDLFWRLAKTDLDADWYLMCPHEIEQVKGYRLEDCYGEEWEKKYYDCVEDERLPKRVLSVKEIVRLMIKSLVETGTPFVFNRDTVNEANPNKHAGMIYSSNLCTEIAQNMSSMHVNEPQIIHKDGDVIVTQTVQPGDFVVCNLASLTLGKIDVNNKERLRHVVRTVTRALDNVIDLNYYPIPYARITNQQMRPIGLGTSGYQHMLVKNNLRFENMEHIDFADALYEEIAYDAIEASCDLAAEKGAYSKFKGSDFDTSAYFEKRGYDSPRWNALAKKVHEQGIRNGYLLAIAPTSSTSIIAGTTAAVDPVMNKYFMEEKKGSMITRVAPDLNPRTFWLYKNAHHIDQNWIVDAAAVRQKHIDQAQSVNLYITNDYTFRQILNLYIRAWSKGVKTIYYVRSQSLEVEECESCSA